MQRVLFLLYGVVCYAVFFATFLYAIGFLGNFAVPKPLDSAAGDPLGVALLINTGLLALFALQHSVMARPGFKRWWTRFVPRPIERSTYVLFSSVALILLFWQWRPFGGMIWDVQHEVGRGALYGLFGFGWLLVLVSTFLIDHFDLFGLKQVWLHLRRKPQPEPRFVTPGPYRFVRHPLYVGWVFAIWATPTMSIAHLFFAVVTTSYILIAIQLEERDLVDALGEPYARYRRDVPMLMPSVTPKVPVRARAGELG